MERGFSQFLNGPETAEHAVQIYRDVTELAESVARYFATGFEEGEPGIVIATAEHWGAVAHMLADQGWDPADAEAQGLLTVRDAVEMLARFMDGDRPSPEDFESVVGGTIDSISARFPDKRVRAFGEMVDLLCRQGKPDAALALEELWNELATTRPFSLLCGYRLDVFDRASQVATLPGVCRTHTHVLPAWDSARLTLAVDRALEEVLGSGQAGKVYLVIGEEARRERVPVGQLALMWVSAHMPALADRVLAAAQAHYEQPALSTT
ncbi:MAG: MEDS domain-containing protein [Actinomycetota bacterium]